MSKKVCEISILGSKYSVKSEETESRVHEIETFVSNKIEEVLKKSKALSVQDATILVTLNIAGEYLKLKESQRDYQDGVMKRSKEILTWIDNQLKKASDIEHVV